MKEKHKNVIVFKIITLTYFVKTPQEIDKSFDWPNPNVCCCDVWCVAAPTPQNIMKYLQSEALEKKQTNYQKGWRMLIIRVRWVLYETTSCNNQHVLKRASPSLPELNTLFQIIAKNNFLAFKNLTPASEVVVYQIRV